MAGFFYIRWRCENILNTLLSFVLQLTLTTVASSFVCSCCMCHIKQYRRMCVLLQRVTCTIQRCLLGSTCLRGRWQNSTCSLFGSFRVRCLASAATFSNSCITCEIMSQPFSVVSVFWHSLWMCVWIRWYFKDRFAVDTDSAGMNVCDFLAPCNGTL